MTFFSELFAALEIAAPILFYFVGFIAVLVTAVSKSGFGGAVALGIPMLLLVTYLLTQVGLEQEWLLLL